MARRRRGRRRRDVDDEWVTSSARERRGVDVMDDAEEDDARRGGGGRMNRTKELFVFARAVEASVVASAVIVERRASNGRAAGSGLIPGRGRANE